MPRPDETSELLPCPACRGRGRKLLSSRRALLLGDGGAGDDERIGERECLDCLASGRVEGSER